MRRWRRQGCRSGARQLPDDARRALEQRWLDLTRVTMPGLAAARGWPIQQDHCFQRVLLDHAFGGCWYHHVTQRPAYRTMTEAALGRAIALGEAIACGHADLAALNHQSLQWRGKTVRPLDKRAVNRDKGA